MNRTIIFILLLMLCVFTGNDTQAESVSESQTKNKETGLVIALTELKVSDKTLELRYQIRNKSKHDVWICEDVEANDEWDFESYLADDNQTLTIRKRLDVWANLESYRQRVGMYVCLQTGEEISRALSLTVPVHPFNIYKAGRTAKGLEYATRLDIEIGYYASDLPGMIRDILEKIEKTSDTNLDKNQAKIKRFLGDIQYFFNELNENQNLTKRILIPYNWQALKGEHNLGITVDGLLIPYEEEWPKPTPPDLSHCTRVEIRYQPSMLNYFFPNAGQQSLLSPTEKEYLQSLNTVVVEDQKHLKILNQELSSLSFVGTKRGTITAPRMAHVMCYRNGKRLTSFTTYWSNWSGAFIRTEEMHRFSCLGGLRSLEMLTPQIETFELRNECVDGLRTLQHHLDSLYSKKKKYPTSKWCDTTVRALSKDLRKDYILNLFKCPSAHKGKCHYAMNPNCKPESPPDMVLLFETKAGWNQHGGPELFTFDNHEPKGGCFIK